MSNRLIPPTTRQSVIDYVNGGNSAREAAAAFQVHQTTVNRWLKVARLETPPVSVSTESLTTMAVHKHAAGKQKRKVSKPKSGPVNTSGLSPELKALLPKDVERIQILDKDTVIVWNSAGQRRKLQAQAKRDHH